MPIEKIIVIEDDLIVRKNIEQQLRNRRYDVAAVDTLSAAYDYLGKDNWDLMLVDVRLPDGEGTEILRELNSRPQKPLVVMMSGFGTVESAVEALKLGAFDYLLKPLEVNQLRCKVDRVREYRSFTNPRAALELHLNLLREVLGTADAVSPETEERINHLRERLDDLFRAFRVMEQTIIDQRLRLAEIAAFAERSRDELDERDPSGPMLDHISAEAARRV